ELDARDARLEPCRVERLAPPHEQRLAPDENDEAEEHADAGGAEAIAPAIGLAQVSGRNGAERRADVDAHIEDCVSAVAANVSARIKLPDDDRDVRLQKARSHDD